MTTMAKDFGAQIDEIAEDAFAVLERHRDDQPGEYSEFLTRHEKMKEETRRKIAAQVEAIYRAGCEDVGEAERRLEAWVRTAVLVIVVGAVAVISMVGLLRGLEAQQFTLYLAPLTGMAGTVIGYWFGTTGLSRPRSRTR